MRYAEYVIALVLVSRIILVNCIRTFWHTSLTTVEEKRLRQKGIITPSVKTLLD